MPAWLVAHWVDIAIILTLAWYAFDGWTRGFLSIALETAGFLLAMLLAVLGYRALGALIAARLSVPPSFANALAFFGIWWVADLAWPLAARPIYRRLPQRWRAAKIDRIFGLLPGLANGVLILSVLLTVVSAFPVSAAIKRQATDAALARPILAVTRGIDRLIAPVLGPLAEESVDMLTVHPESGERIDLHFTVHDGKVDAASEQRMLTLVNAERTKRGLRPLVLSSSLTGVARAYARDMFERGYFSHVSPEGLTPPDRLDRAGIPYGVMGENLALAPDVLIAHDGLMNSPGHRANILGASFRRVGIGVIDGGVYGEMFVQEFTD